MKEIYNKLKNFELKDDKQFNNFNYDCISLSKAFLYYYDKLDSLDLDLFEFFKEIQFNEIRKLLEDFENDCFRRFLIRKRLTRLIEPNKKIMINFVSFIENCEGNPLDDFENE